MLYKEMRCVESPSIPIDDTKDYLAAINLDEIQEELNLTHSPQHVPLTSEEQTKQNSYLLKAIEAHNIPETINALKNGADIDTKTDWREETSLGVAACHGFIALVELLINNKANIDEPACDKDTPLMQAARNGHEATVQMLVIAGADVNIKNYAGKTILDGFYTVPVSRPDLALKRQAQAIKMAELAKGALEEKNALGSQNWFFHDLVNYDVLGQYVPDSLGEIIFHYAHHTSTNPCTNKIIQAQIRRNKRQFARQHISHLTPTRVKRKHSVTIENSKVVKSKSDAVAHDGAAAYDNDNNS